MNNINKRTLLSLLLGVSVIVFYAFFELQDTETIEFTTLASLISKVVSVDLLILGIFSTYLWRFKMFRGWLVPFPDLQGTWKGSIQTTWVDERKGELPDAVSAILTIKQSFLNISCVMRTEEMTSRSSYSGFMLDADKQLKRLIYSYESNPSPLVKVTSPQHYGTMMFEIVENPDLKMVGEYWTNRKTTGQIEMSFWQSDMLEYFPDDIGDHPIQEDTNVV
jgi:hypothetical protein